MLSKQKTHRDRLPDAERTEVLAPLPVAELRKYEAVKKDVYKRQVFHEGRHQAR